MATPRSVCGAALVLVFCALPLHGQVFGVVQGRVFDATGIPLTTATVRIQALGGGFSVSVGTDMEGRYYVAPLPAGVYVVSARAPGFRTELIERLTVDLGRVIVRDFHLVVGAQTEVVVVRAEMPLIDRAGTPGHIVSAPVVQEVPLNGRHFIDLSLLVPNAVAPSQTGFSSRPIRGVGSLAFNIGGHREEAVGFIVNGVTTNNLTFGSLIFEPPLGSIQEFRVDQSPFGAEFGHVSGAVVSIATRSGTDTVRGEVFEYFRDDALDARNSFELRSQPPSPFRRHQFGGSLGGPIWRGRTFYHAVYEGFRQRQRVDMNSLVLSDEQRAAVSDPVIRQLLPLIPAANHLDAAGTARFVGSAPANVETDRWTVDLKHNLGIRDVVQVFYGAQRLRANEPGTAGNSIPGFGIVLQPRASTLTATALHTFGSGLLNEARFGRSRLIGGTFPAAALNPAEFGVNNGVSRPIGLPQMVIAGDLNFGGPAAQPQGRYDTSYVFNDTVSHARGRHLFKFGGEYRHFINENFAEGTGLFNFPSISAFMAASANSFNITLGERRSVIDQRAWSLFIQDRVEVGARLTLDLGLRYEWHMTPTERDNKFVVFDASTASLLRVGEHIGAGIYRQNNHNLSPRAGLAWAVTRDARTIVRAAYARSVDQPSTTAVRDTSGNPPFAVPLTATGAIPLSSAIDFTNPGGLAPATIDPRFTNASLHSWSVQVQRQIAWDAAASIGYTGSRGQHLRITRNVNQPVGGVRPFVTVSPSSPIRPGAALGNISQVESTGFSRYHSGWIALTKRLSHGLQFDASYTLSDSRDTNSLNSSGFAIQNAYDIPDEYGLSDYHARHRLVISAIYQLPFTDHLLTRGWQMAVVVQSQSGNPVNVVTPTSVVNGIPNTVRPDVVGPVRIIGDVDEWFDPSAFVAVNGFGTLGRNAVIGPAFHNVDLSLIKHLRSGPMSVRLRADAFNVFNHANFGPPGNIVGTPSFGRITRTRLPTGEAGSSRQVQLAVKVTF